MLLTQKTLTLTKTIAILEPHEILRLCLIEVLSHLNYNILFKSGSAIDFIEMLATAEEQPDIIIAEVQLYDLQDISLFRHLRYHYPGIKLLAFSADDTERTVELVLQEGADAFLAKGCSLQQIQHALELVYRSELQPR